MEKKRGFSLIVLTALLVLLMSSVSFAKTKEVGPGIPVIAPEDELLSIINAKRGQQSLAPLLWDEDLAKVAALRASEIAVSYGHTRPNGSEPQTAYKEAGVSFSRAGENLSQNIEEAADVYTDWYKSRASRDNLLRKEFTHAAIAWYDRPNEDGTVTRFWVIELMRPKQTSTEENAETEPADTAESTAAENNGNDIPDTDTVSVQ